ncbi:MAG TPA: hypothetical protein EYN08_02050 [Gammaproteobacteria bacterium]|nr:hypothetical protein [Gammaproteobacteria bacterium]
MEISGKKLNKIIKEEVDLFLLSEGVESSAITNLKEPVPSDPEALANNIKIASRVIEELVGGELAELAGVTKKLAVAAQAMREVLDDLSVKNPNHLGDYAAVRPDPQPAAPGSVIIP